MTSWPSPKLRPLPRTVAPFRDETNSSYLRRLAAVNHLDARDLYIHLNPDSPTASWLPGKVRLPLDALAAASGKPASNLACALPELREQLPAEYAKRRGTFTRAGRPNATRAACRRCTAAKGIADEVEVWNRHDHNVCVRHKFWTGTGAFTRDQQLDLSPTPEIVKAQRWHRALITRYGHDQVHVQFNEAHRIVFHWDQFNRDSVRFTRYMILDRDKLDTVVRRTTEYAGVYPEVVALTSVLASPYWQQAALASTPNFQDHVQRRGLPGWSPTNTQTELADWIERLRSDTHGTYADYRHGHPSPLERSEVE